MTGIQVRWLAPSDAVAVEFNSYQFSLPPDAKTRFVMTPKTARELRDQNALVEDPEVSEKAGA